MPARAGGRPVRYRRSPHIVSYWAGGGLLFHNYATGRTVSGAPLTIGLLDFFSTWKSARALIERSSLPASEIEEAIDALHRASLVQRSDVALSPIERTLDRWESWNPAAGFFHFSTKDVPYVTNEDAHAFVASKAASVPLPKTLKRYPGRRSISLPDAPGAGAIHDVLLRRRTWRRFSARAMSRQLLASLLWWTFGAQKWMDLGPAGAAMLRTSPSAGARNPLEAYVVVRHVSGLARGIYHYAPAEHALVPLSHRHRPFDEYLPQQWWYRRAAALVVITAITARTRWRYPFARAYRALLIEAGHFAQTFCLTAASLDLAPFCSAALADTTIERDLGIDGVAECVLYACGVGVRPDGVDWAPSPNIQDTPPLFTPRHEARPSRHRRREILRKLPHT